MKFNLVKNEGEASSIMVFAGKVSFIATKDHPNFNRIVTALEGGETDTETIRQLFDSGYAIATNFQRLSERVTVSKGRIYLDGDEVDTALSQTIVRFYSDGNDDFKPLVAFMEKLETNPNPHSVDHLFRWLAKKNIAITPDGDFIAYKGVRGDFHSINAGTAMVNGETIAGTIPNKADTIIEMPRSQVTFDPAHGCSTGLHAGNWRYASEFAQGKVLRVKINPRDVVSVPVDSNDEKLRVCRYRVLNVVSQEDRTALYIPDFERLAKVAGSAPKPVPVPDPIPEDVPVASVKKPVLDKIVPLKENDEFPEYYHDFKTRHFRACNMKELRWLAKEWEVKEPQKMDRARLITVLVAAATKQRRAYIASQT